MGEIEDLIISGVFKLAREPHFDERGSFCRQFDLSLMSDRLLDQHISYTAITRNTKAFTWRGMHYQLAPFAEGKLVSAVQGSILDVVLDLRPNSMTCKKSIKIGMEMGDSIWIPPGCAHGYLTREADTIVSYAITTPYSPKHYRGIRWNDPTFNLRIPTPKVISGQDASWKDFDPVYHLGLISGPAGDGGV